MNGWGLAEVGIILTGIAIVTTAYVWIVRLMLDNRLLKMFGEFRLECNKKYASREVLVERFKAVEVWLAKMEGKLVMLETRLVGWIGDRK